jgi:hypothetical protein
MARADQAPDQAEGDPFDHRMAQDAGARPANQIRRDRGHEGPMEDADQGVPDDGEFATMKTHVVHGLDILDDGRDRHFDGSVRDATPRVPPKARSRLEGLSDRKVEARADRLVARHFPIH